MEASVFAYHVRGGPVPSLVTSPPYEPNAGALAGKA